MLENINTMRRVFNRESMAFKDESSNLTVSRNAKAMGPPAEVVNRPGYKSRGKAQL